MRKYVHVKACPVDQVFNLAKPIAFLYPKKSATSD